MSKPAFGAVQYVEGKITFTDTTAVVIGQLPPNSVIVDAGATIVEAFNGTTPTIDIGVAADPDELTTTAITASAVGVARCSDANLAAAADCFTDALPKDLTAIFVSAGGSPSTGIAYCWVAFKQRSQP